MRDNKYESSINDILKFYYSHNNDDYHVALNVWDNICGSTIPLTYMEQLLWETKRTPLNEYIEEMYGYDQEEDEDDYDEFDMPTKWYFRVLEYKENN